MVRETAYSSVDYTQVEPLLVRPSGGSHPSAAVAWSELDAAVSTRIDAIALERALASLFADVPLDNGITESRPALEGSDNYFFTRFEIDLPALFGASWATRRISDDALLDALGNRLNYTYDFKITGEGLFTIEFQSASQNPVITNNSLILVVQRRPFLAALVPPSDTTLVPGFSRYTFPNGASIFVNDDLTVSVFAADGTAQEQQNDIAPGTKANSTGFMTLNDNGSYSRYLLGASNVILPPTPATQAEYNAF